MKYSDDLFDVNQDLVMASGIGVLCGLASAFATISDVGAAYVFISILIGNLLALKVDGIHHVITLLVFIVICLIAGIPEMSLAVLLICIFGALADEVGHELISTVTDNKFLNLFFEYRFVLKIVILLLAICGAFDFMVFVYFILFEIAYLIGGIFFEMLDKKRS